MTAGFLQWTNSSDSGLSKGETRKGARVVMESQLALAWGPGEGVWLLPSMK